MLLSYVLIALYCRILRSQHILDIRFILSDMWIANIFTPLQHVFYSSYMAFHRANILISMKFNLSFFSFMDVLWLSRLRTLVQSQIPKFFPPTFTFLNFLVLLFTFKSVIHFELILFINFVTLCFAQGSPNALASFLEKAIFPPLNCLCIFVKHHVGMFCFIDLCVHSSATSTHSHDYCSLKSNGQILSSLLFFFKIVLAI